jgi:hypothetical protein
VPFRKGYEALYDQTTLADLQDTLEHVWLAIKDVHVGLVAREDIAQLIFPPKRPESLPIALRSKCSRG